MNRAAAVVAAALALSAPAAAAAQPPLLLDPEPRPGFLSRLDGYLSMEALGEGDPRFRWDADAGFHVDIVDWGGGRAAFQFNYEAVLADELQPFDPRQGNYALDLLGALRAGRTEIALRFHHLSRHLGDRPKPFGIAWNDLGVEATHVRGSGGDRVQVRAFALATVMRSAVDYAGNLGAEVAGRRHLSPRVSLVASGGGHLRLVDRSRAGRGAQRGGRVELGLRVAGTRGALEIVAGGEQRVDADAIEARARRWVFAGARLVTR
jgi:hypothetical protein